MHTELHNFPRFIYLISVSDEFRSQEVARSVNSEIILWKMKYILRLLWPLYDARLYSRLNTKKPWLKWSNQFAQAPYIKVCRSFNWPILTISISFTRLQRKKAVQRKDSRMFAFAYINFYWRYREKESEIYWSSSHQSSSASVHRIWDRWMSSTQNAKKKWQNGDGNVRERARVRDERKREQKEFDEE